MMRKWGVSRFSAKPNGGMSKQPNNTKRNLLKTGWITVLSHERILESRVSWVLSLVLLSVHIPYRFNAFFYELEQGDVPFLEKVTALPVLLAAAIRR